MSPTLHHYPFLIIQSHPSHISYPSQFHNLTFKIMKMNFPSFSISPYMELFAVFLLISTMFHVFTISGLSFVMPPSGKVHAFPTMDVILVQKKTSAVPEKPDFLAQVTQDGSGQGDPKKQARPSTPTLAPFPGPTAELVAIPPPLQVAANPIEPELMQLFTLQPSSFQIEKQPLVPIRPPEEPIKEIQADGEETVIFPEELPNLDTLIFAELSQLASIQAELNERFENFVRRPVRHKYVNSSTKESIYVEYMENWRGKAEPSANKEYQKLGKRIEGVIVLDVAINANGTINDIKLIKSSIRSPELERVARLSIRKVAPFPSFPNSIRKEKIEVLHIVRTWEFSYKNKKKVTTH